MERLDRTFSRAQVDFRRAMTSQQIDPLSFLNEPVHYDPFAPNRIPFALRIKGSILGGMLPTLFFFGIWSSAVCYISMHHYSLAVEGLLITVTGLVTSLALAFRVNSAYERYSEGRKYWTQLSKVIRSTSRMIWWTVPEGPMDRARAYTPEEKEEIIKDGLLTKATAIRILLGFAYALKHHLRGEFGTDWDDMRDLIEFLPTYGRMRSDLEKRYTQHPQRRRTNSTTASLTTTFMRGLKPPKRQPSNKLIKATIAHGNLPLELLSFFGCYVDLLDQSQKISPTLKSFFSDQMNQLQEILAGCERVLQTPLPLAFNISIAQITWTFMMLLPFQLVGSLRWITIPATIASAYMLLGLSHLSYEIENPFGTDANDLPLDRICDVLMTDVDVICAHRMSSSTLDGKTWLYSAKNKPLAPVVQRGIAECLENMSVEEIREALRLKVERVRGERVSEQILRQEDGEQKPEDEETTARGSASNEAVHKKPAEAIV